MLASGVWPVLGLVFNALVWGISWWPLRQLQLAGLHPVWATALFFAIGAVVVGPGLGRNDRAHALLDAVLPGAGFGDQRDRTTLGIQATGDVALQQARDFGGAGEHHAHDAGRGHQRRAEYRVPQHPSIDAARRRRPT